MNFRTILLLQFTSYFLPHVYSMKASPIIVNTASGTFSYPDYPNRYTAAREVTWLITVEQGKYINLTLEVKDVEAYRGQCIDIIEIKDGNNSKAPLLGGYCNSNKPPCSILSSGNALRVWFQSANNSAGGLGFTISYTSIDEEACGGQLRTFPGTITTPRYPQPYPNNRECKWKIQAPRGQYIQVQFNGVYRLEYLCTFTGCECVDRLEIRENGKTLRQEPRLGYCFARPRHFTSNTNEVDITFSSDYAGRFEGFNVSYTTSLTKGCGADLRGKHGIVTSPLYPHRYPSYAYCIWRIRAPDDHLVTITFQEFDVQKSKYACRKHSLTIRDGYSGRSPLLGILCNGNSTKQVNSSGSQMYLAFSSGFNLNSLGFKATFDSHKKDQK